MLNPIKSETDAFRVAIGSTLLTGVSVLTGFLVAPIFGYALFAAGVAAALAFTLVGRDPDRAQRLREAAESPHPDAPRAKYRILLVANEALAGPEVRKEILRRVELWPELLVVAPVLSSRSHYWASDFDRELEEARERLGETLAWAAEQGLDARGEVGDPDPFIAIEDALRRFGADEVIIATHPPEQSNWLESNVVERVRDELELRITHAVVDRERDRVEIPSEPPAELPREGGAVLGAL